MKPNECFTSGSDGPEPFIPNKNILHAVNSKTLSLLNIMKTNVLNVFTYSGRFTHTIVDSLFLKYY